MKKTALIALVILGFISCKENNSKVQTESNVQNSEVETIKFPTEKESCEKTKYLFEAIPHLDQFKDYNLESVECFGNGIGIRYNHPTQKNYEIQVFIYEEKTEHKPMYNIATAGFEMTSGMKVNGTDVSDLKIFDNAVLTIKKDPEYYDVHYNATYKKNYTIMIGVRGKDLSNKQKVDNFLKKYLEAFKKEELN